MARINTNIAALLAQRHLDNSYKQLNTSILRLSSGLRINRGADDPVGLYVSERLRSEIKAINQAIVNTQRASNIIATTEGALEEVASLLNDIEQKVVEVANRGALSEDEIKANQLQLDSAISSITRIANTTTFAGRHLINGSLGYITSGVNTSQINALNIHSVQFGTLNYIPININVIQSAQTAALFFTSAAVRQNVTVEIAGNLGVTTLSFASGAAASAMVVAINTVRDAIGVSASFINQANPASGFVLRSQNLGSRQFVSVKALPGSGNFTTYTAASGGGIASRDEGRDATALINGALSIGDGNLLTLTTPALDMELNLARTFGLGTTSFSITKGGALFQVGPEVNSNLQVNIGVQSVAASRLGNTEVGFLSQIQSDGPYALTKGRAQEAQRIIREAIRQISILRGRLGTFEKNTLDTNANQLSITLENVRASESTIRDADFAYETSMLSRNQLLVASGTSVLALANQAPQSVLRLLG